MDNIINDYILEDDELLELKSKFLSQDVYKDENHKIIAQDLLYQTLDKQVGLNRNYWRIGTTNDLGDSYWKYMVNNKKACIGWSPIGDLKSQVISSKKDIQKLLRDTNHYKNDKRT